MFHKCRKHFSSFFLFFYFVLFLFRFIAYLRKEKESSSGINNLKPGQFHKHNCAINMERTKYSNHSLEDPCAFFST